MEKESKDKSSTPPQLIVGFEELHTVMLRNDCKLLGLFDELSCFYGQLDLYKHSSTVDRKTLLTLNGGGFWGRNFKCYSAQMQNTAFNVCGFIQPSYVYDMLTKSPDADGLNDRQLFDFPPEREVLLDDLKVPMPDDTPSLVDTFLEIMKNHKEAKLYTFEGSAYAAFRDIHDGLIHQKLKTKNEDAQGILAKARGYAARIAMVLHVLEQALHIVVNGEAEEEWEVSVSTNAVKAAGTIITHFTSQKCIMLGLSEDGIDTSPSLSKKLIRLLSMPTRRGDGIIMPSEVSQKHISEKVGASYPASKAMELIEEAVSQGYGELEESQSPNKKITKRFRKRKLCELSEECQSNLKKSCVSDDNYNKAFHGANKESQEAED